MNAVNSQNLKETTIWKGTTEIEIRSARESSAAEHSTSLLQNIREVGMKTSSRALEQIDATSTSRSAAATLSVSNSQSAAAAATERQQCSSSGLVTTDPIRRTSWKLVLQVVFSLFAILFLYFSLCFTERYRRLIAEEEEHAEETPVLPDLSFSIPIGNRVRNRSMKTVIQKRSETTRQNFDCFHRPSKEVCGLETIWTSNILQEDSLNRFELLTYSLQE